MDKQKYQLEKLTNRKTGYPLATLAYYGPDDQFASKAVVGIMPSEKDEEPTELRKWFAKDLDVRQDPEIIHEMLAFYQATTCTGLRRETGLLDARMKRALIILWEKLARSAPFGKTATVGQVN